MKRAPLTVLLVMGVACGPEHEHAASSRSALEVRAAFQDGVSEGGAYLGTQDTFLDEREDGTNSGDSLAVIVDGDDSSGGGGDKPKVGLLRWELSVPQDATLTAVTVVVWINEASAEQFTVHAMLRPWEELEATWLQPQSGITWGTAGASGASDRDPAPLATIQPGVTGALAFSLNQAGIARVAEWIADPTTNHGLAFTADPAIGDGFEFHSREHAVATERPLLELEYSLAGADGGTGGQDGGSDPGADAGEADAGEADGGAPDGAGGDDDAGATPLLTDGGPGGPGIYRVACGCSAGGTPLGLIAVLLTAVSTRLRRRPRGR